MNIKAVPFHEASFRELETFPAPARGEPIQIVHPEFSSLCPKTSYPDFATVILEYCPADKCVELKSWKLFLLCFYGVGCYHEAVTKHVFDRIVAALDPHYLRLTFNWGARGGLHTVTCLEHQSRLGGIPDIRGHRELFGSHLFTRAAVWGNR